jgi:hypothetical protein
MNQREHPAEKLCLERRELLKLLTLGGVVSASGLGGCAAQAGTTSPAAGPTAELGGTIPNLAPAASVAARDFWFLQLSDTHWGYDGPANPEASHTLIDTVATINASPLEPAFVVFTGDLTQMTEDPAERRRRLKEFARIVDDLKVKTRYYLPGEHDAAPDGGEAYREIFGETYGSFDHEGVHFVRLDNVSAGSAVGDAELAWLASDLERLPRTTPLVIFAHRPLFELYPSWDWTTANGASVLDLARDFASVNVFYGHIHQEHHVTTPGGARHHAARSLIFPLPAPGSVPKKAPLPWDAESHDHGLGYRSIDESTRGPRLSEVAVVPAARSPSPASSLL